MKQNGRSFGVLRIGEREVLITNKHVAQALAERQKEIEEVRKHAFLMETEWQSVRKVFHELSRHWWTRLGRWLRVIR